MTRAFRWWITTAVLWGFSMALLGVACGGADEQTSNGGIAATHDEAGHVAAGRGGGSGGHAGYADRSGAGHGGNAAAAAGRGGSDASSVSDGARAAAVDGGTAGGGPDRELGDHCTFSDVVDWRTHDGKKLVAHCGSDGLDLGLLTLDGHFTRLASAPNATHIVLTDTQLLYLQAKQLLSVSLEGGDVKQVATDVYDKLYFSADRSGALFDRGYDSSGKTPVIAVVTQDMMQRQVASAQNETTLLTPDGMHALYNASAGELDAVDLTGGKSVRLGVAYVGSLSPVVSNNQKLVAFYDTDLHYIVVAQWDGTTVQLGDKSSQDLVPLAFTPDDTKVLVTSADYVVSGARTLLLGVDGKSATPIATDKQFHLIDISQGGSLLSTQTTDNSSSPELWLYANNGSKMLGQVERCSDSRVQSAVLSTDRHRAAFVDLSGVFTIVDLESAATVATAKSAVAIGSTCYAYPHWSPDDSLVLLTQCKNEGADCAVVSINASTGELGPSLGTRPAELAEFSRDSKYVAYGDGGGSFELYALSGQSILQMGYGATHQTDSSELIWDAHWLDEKHFVYGNSSIYLVTVQ